MQPLFTRKTGHILQGREAVLNNRGMTPDPFAGVPAWLELVLETFAPRTAGLQLYFPQRTQTQPKLRAFIDAARRVLREP
jgi:hypothetical protein